VPSADGDLGAVAEVLRNGNLQASAVLAFLEVAIDDAAVATALVVPSPDRTRAGVGGCKDPGCRKADQQRVAGQPPGCTPDVA
jgi:hypothetical protein